MPSAGLKRRKPLKPYPSFPLTPHNNGQWCKKIRGKVHFFGVWEDPITALSKYHAAAGDLHAGRQPRPTLSQEAVTVKDVCNHYLTYQLRKVDAREIGARWLEDCRRVIGTFAKFVGSATVVADLRPNDFERFRHCLVTKGIGGKKGLGVHALNRAITVIKGLFKYAFEADLLDKPMKYGTGFGKPSAATRRKARQTAEFENGKKLFEPTEVLYLLDNAGMPLRAMTLLGINGGMGNSDCARLPIAAVDLERRVIEFSRPKTGIERVVPLWPESAEALRAAVAGRPKPATEEASKLVFLTAFGRPWVRNNLHRTEDNAVNKVVPIDAIGGAYNRLLRQLGLKRRGLGFYTLRHTFRTWADETNDQHAIHRIMGHAIPGMSGIYIGKIELERLRAVVDHVRGKLFDKEGSVSK